MIGSSPELAVRQQPAPHLGRHDELVVDDVVGRVAHTKQGAGGMQVTRHACPHVDIFTDALGANTDTNSKLKVCLIIYRCKSEPPPLVLRSPACVHSRTVSVEKVVRVNLLLHLA